MFDNFLNKYKPNNINNVIGNKNKIKDIEKWFNDKNKTFMLLTGNYGIGKDTIIKLLIKKYDYSYKWIDYKDDKSKNLLDDIINCNQGQNIKKLFNENNKKFILVINNIDKITLKSEKVNIKKLISENKEKHLFPVIFISNMIYNKLISDISIISNNIKLSNIRDSEMLEYLNIIIKNENINIENNDVKYEIIKYVESDVRKLLMILYDIKNCFDNEIIDINLINYYFNHSEKKIKDTTLFQAVRELITNYDNVSNRLDLYKVDKVLIPLTLYENYHRFIDNNTKINKLELLKNISSSISLGDVIETNIYTDQNWYLHNIHGFETCVKTSYNINKYNIENKPHMGFSTDLNKTSLKNINKKQLINLQKIFKNKSYEDIIYLSNIVYHLIKNNNIKELYNIMKSYDLNIKTIEIMLKIDKTLPKLTLNAKNKKSFNNYIKINK